MGLKRIELCSNKLTMTTNSKVLIGEAIKESIFIDVRGNGLGKSKLTAR